ncbi:hypothetical protein ACL02S_11090 [Nocardia sp. 004]|uniref:hypothetical protein n=1 Tax=Nocardia sp. 004 TaxID=3385978 RepID=UPI0039A3883B
MATAPDRIPAEVDTKALIDEFDAAMVALTFVDNAGITRMRAVPTPRLPHAARFGGGVSRTDHRCHGIDSGTAERGYRAGFGHDTG